MSSEKMKGGKISGPKSSLCETIVAVFPDSKAGKKALQALELATDKSSSEIERIPFHQLDFGDLKALEKFYSTPVAVVDVTERQYEACLFYQIGLRESFGMKHNVVMCRDQESSYISSRKSSMRADQTQLGAVTTSIGVSRTYDTVACRRGKSLV